MCGRGPAAARGVLPPVGSLLRVQLPDGGQGLARSAPVTVLCSARMMAVTQMESSRWNLGSASSRASAELKVAVPYGS